MTNENNVDGEFCIHDDNGEEKKKIEHHFHLPALERQFARQVTHYQQEEKRLQQITKLYDAAFIKWDEYCKHIIGRESSESLLLPAFPNSSLAMNENEVPRVINAHAKIIARCIAGSMRDEFDILSTQFLHSLSNSGIDEREAGTLGKCYGYLYLCCHYALQQSLPHCIAL